MPSFGTKSQAELDTCHEDLQKVANKAIQIMDFSVVDGHRTEEQQNDYFERGVSKIQWPDGKHNKTPSQAFDLAPYPIDWSNKPKAIARFYLLAGVVLAVAAEMNIKLRWGGDWDGDWDLFDQNFDDLGH